MGFDINSCLTIPFFFDKELKTYLDLQTRVLQIYFSNFFLTNFLRFYYQILLKSSYTFGD